MSDELQIAIEAAKKGAAKALTYFGNNPTVMIKPDHSPVTQADKESEEIIKSFILSQDKNAKFIGEEGGGNLDVDETWIIDPIDGTKNFMRGIPQWAVLIAHYKNGVCDVGISYIPVIDEMCYAQKGKGSFINAKQIHVSKIDKLSDAYFSHGETMTFNNIPALLTLSKQVFTQRSHGDAATYNNLASGKIDIVADPKNHVWDSAPFSIIIPEAGGKVSTLDGKPWTVHATDFLATNGFLHDQVIEILNPKQ
jgi:histidinol-phosphatase